MPSTDPQTFLQPAIHTFFNSMQNAPLLGRDLYLDPGSGSYLLQLLIAGLVGSAFMVRTFWSRIKNFFTRNSAEDEVGASDDKE